MVTSRRLFIGGAVAAVVIAGIVGLVAWTSWDGGGGPGLGEEPIVGTAFLEPEQHLFGDALRARVELIVDTTRVDPDTVEIGANFEPYVEIRPAERTTTSNGSITRIHYDYLLACLASRCLPRGSGRVELGGVAVNYTRRGSVEPDAATLNLVPLRTAGRIDPDELEQAALRSDLRDLPTPSYSISPRAVELVALLLAVLFAIAAAVLILRLLPLDRLATRLGARFVDKRSPLEQALALVRESSEKGEPDRQALERLAVELRRTGDPALASDASRLAWSHERPQPAGVAPLSDEVQRTISENGR